MKEKPRNDMLKAPLTFDLRLAHARLLRQNVLLIKWVLVAVSITLILVYFLTPIRDLIFVS